MAETPQPLAKGDLRKSPLAHVVASLNRKGADGTLVIWPEPGGSGQDRFRFVSGLPVAARTRSPASSLEAALLALADRASGAYALFAEDLVGTPTVTGRVEIAPLLRRLVLATGRSDGLERVLARRGDAQLRVKRVTPATLGLEREEVEVLEVLRAGPASVEALAAKSGRPEMARRLVYLLELLGAIETLDASPRPPGEITGSFSLPRGAPPEAPAPAAPAAPPAEPPTSGAPEPSAPRFPEPPAGLRDADRERWDEIVSRARAEDGQTHYEVLGVAPDASTKEIEQAYVRAAKLVHPDRLGPALGPLREHADKVFRRATEARGTLIDDDRRADYDARMREGGGSPESERQVEEIVEAALEYQRVDLLLRKRAYDDALRIIDRNLELNPDVADYPAKKAYALFLARGVDDRAVRREILALLDTALRLDERHEAAHFTKGQVLKKAGDSGRALAHFRAAVSANPHNIDAAREVRLASLKKKDDKSEAEGGLLGRLFKKKR